jgi:subtilase family serine protease
MKTPQSPARTVLSIVALALVATLAGSAAGAQSSRKLLPDRLAGPIDNAARAPLPGSTPPRAMRSTDLGAIDAKTPLTGITLTFSRSAAQQADLDQLIAAQQNPASAVYHQWLTPAQFGARFGISDNDLATTESWLQSQNFTVISVSPSRDSITFSGSAAAVESAFGAPLHYFRATSGSMLAATTDTRTHFAPAHDLTLPASLSSLVLAVGNLSDYRPQSHAIKRPVADFTSATSGSNFVTPKDVATIYDVNAAYNAGYSGSGQTIVVAGESAVLASDISNFQNAAGVAANTPNYILMPNTGASTRYTGDEAESDLDLEYTSTIAPKATIDFIYAGSSPNYGVFDAFIYAVQNQIGTIISISYGECEPDLMLSGFNMYEAYLKQAATQGQTVINSSGDSGSPGCYGDSTTTTSAYQQQLAVSYPASSAYVTGLGGTEFPAADISYSTSSSGLIVGSNSATYWTPASGSDVISSARMYIPEQAWNDDAANGSPSSGGGGVSIFAARPTWQTGVTGIPSGTFRLVPDISLDSSADDAGYLYCSSDSGAAQGVGFTGSCTNGFRVGSGVFTSNGASAVGDLTVAGGTSFAAPIFAGMLALINQAKGFTTGQGLINPELYSLASNSTTYASAFHDITIGGNQCLAGASVCGTGAATTSYAATTGYDEATGLGSIDLYKLITAWPANSTATTTKSFTVSAPAISVTAGNSVTETLTVTPANGYTGTVNFTLPTNLGGVANICYTTPAAVSVTGTAAVSTTFTIYTSASSCSTSGVTALHVASSKPPTLPAGPSSPWKQAPIPAALAGMLLIACSRRRSGMLRISGTLAISLFALGISSFALTGCSNNASGTTSTSTTTTTTTNATPGTYSFVVKGTDNASSSITSSATVSLTVN